MVKNPQGTTFKGSIKFKNHRSVIKSKDPNIKIKYQYNIKHDMTDLKRTSRWMIKGSKLVMYGLNKTTGEKDENTTNILRTANSVKHGAKNTYRYGVKPVAKGIKKAYDGSKDIVKETSKTYQTQLNKQLEKQRNIKKSKEKPKKGKANKSSTNGFVKEEKHKRVTKVLDKKTTNRKVKGTAYTKQKIGIKKVGVGKKVLSKSLAKKTGVKATGIVGTKVAVTGKAMLAIKVKASVTATAKALFLTAKKVSMAIVVKLAIPLAAVVLVLLLLVSVFMAVAGIGASMFFDGFIPIEEEVLVSEMHTFLTRLDIQNDVSGRTDTKDVIALVFASGIVDPERENNDDILREVENIHTLLHENNNSITEMIAAHPTVTDEVAEEFEEFRKLAFINFYNTLGEPYESDNWRSYITSHFGYRPHPTEIGAIDLHTGIDVGKPGGTPILATIDGTVTIAGYHSGGYGNWVQITNTETNQVTRYAHLQRINVRVGQRLRRGDVVGLTGTTGWSTGDHLHHEFFRDGNLLNPYFYYPPTDPEVREKMGLD